MNEGGKSDGLIGPANLPNNALLAGVPDGGVAEVGEERRPAKGNTASKTHPGRSAGSDARSALVRVREVAERDREVRFTALLHHVDLKCLWAAYTAIKPDAAPGVDGVRWAEYGQDLRVNLEDLLRRVHSGAYQARPVRRAFIPKPDGRLRPLGIAALEDKIVQRAVVEVLNAVFEADFVGFSYGFRPGRKPHDALDAVSVGIQSRKVNWVLDADIREFFSNLDHSWLREFLQHRIADRRVLRLIDQWLAAGVIQDGEWEKTEGGPPQGQATSPLLANIYLHYVFDLWAKWWRDQHADGDVIIVRFADDFIVGFQHETDARRFLTELRERFAKFGLELHPDKTRLIEFGRYAAARRGSRGLGKPETFDFLGFTHISGRTRKGRFTVKRITIAKRMRAKLAQIKDQFTYRRYHPIPVQGRWLSAVITGHRAYYAVPGNTDAVQAFRTQVIRLWRQALRRRSQKTTITWERINQLAKRWLPPTRVTHPYPNQRLCAIT